MAKKCVKVAASRRSKAHVRCYQAADVAPKKADNKKGGSGGSSGVSGGSGSSKSGSSEYGEPNEKYNDSYNEAVKKGHLPKDMSYNEVMEMSGMHPDFGKVTSKSFKVTDEGFEVEFETDQILIRTQHSKDKVYIDLVLDAGSGEKGKARKMLGSIIKRGQQQDLKTIELFGAANVFGDPANGYYTWPRLGFETKNKKSLMQYNDFPGSKFKGVDSLSKLMSTKEGRDYWKSDGKFNPDKSVYDMTFSLKEGSANLNFFNDNP